MFDNGKVSKIEKNKERKEEACAADKVKTSNYRIIDTHTKILLTLSRY